MSEQQLIEHFQNMLLHLDEDFKTMLNRRPLLAHYTSMDVLHKILLDGEIWFSNPLFMNDLEEMRFGMHEGRRAFETSDAVANLCASRSRFDIILRAFNHYFSLFETEHAFDVYVFCLSEHDADNTDGSLSMWRGYGGQGSGAALVFNTSFVTSSSKSPLVITKVSTTPGKIVFIG